jgi:hypothetical protein
MLREARRAVRVWKPKRLVMDSQTVIGDAGYGSEENYQYWERQKIEAVIKYGTHRKEQSRKWKEYPWNRGGCG